MNVLIRTLFVVVLLARALFGVEPPGSNSDDEKEVERKEFKVAEGQSLRLVTTQHLCSTKEEERLQLQGAARRRWIRDVAVHFVDGEGTRKLGRILVTIMPEGDPFPYPSPTVIRDARIIGNDVYVVLTAYVTTSLYRLESDVDGKYTDGKLISVLAGGAIWSAVKPDYDEDDTLMEGPVSGARIVGKDHIKLVIEVEFDGGNTKMIRRIPLLAKKH